MSVSSRQSVVTVNPEPVFPPPSRLPILAIHSASLLYQTRLSAPYSEVSIEIAGQITLSKVHGGRILEMANREAQQVLSGAGY